jgi:hypothetical protein
MFALLVMTPLSVLAALVLMATVLLVLLVSLAFSVTLVFFVLATAAGPELHLRAPTPDPVAEREGDGADRATDDPALCVASHR